MKMGVLGSGMVGQAIGARLAELGHATVIGTRDAGKLAEWRKAQPLVEVASFAEASAHGEMLFNATHGMASLEALRMAGEANLHGKILVDISNPLDFSKGFPPTLSVGNSDSLGEQIQSAFPSARVVKTLNTVTARLMAYPRELADGEHTLFVSGNDPDAKAQVTALLQSFGWRDIFDLGDITTARGSESYLLLWLRMYSTLQNGMINVKLVR